MASDEVVARVKDATDIVELIGEYVPLQRSGTRFKGLCPFHLEKTPSFTVNPEMKMFYCFGCHAGGDIYEFIMKHEGLAFPEALELLARRAGIPLDKKRAQDPAERHKMALLEIHREAQEFFVKQMRTTRPGHKAMEYLRSRSIPEEMWEVYGLGYAPDQWRALMGTLSSNGATLDQMADSGLVVRKEGKSYDRFRNRVTFPITRGKGRTVAFGGRALDPENPAKYINSPTTPIYDKGRAVYGFDQARHAIVDANEVVIAEGYLDVIMCNSAGIQNAVSPLGTSLTREQAQLLRRHCDRMIVVFDGDVAGQEASLRALEVCVEEGFTVRVASLPQGMDPCDVVVNEGPDALREALNDARGLVRLRISQHGLSRNASVEQKVSLLEELLPLLAKVQSEVELDAYVGEVAEKFTVSEAVVRRELSRFRRTGRVEARVLKSAPRLNGVAVACKGLLALSLQFPHMRKGIFDGFGEGQVGDSVYGTLLRKARQLHDVGEEWDAATLLRESPASLQTALSELVVASEDFQDPEAAMRDCLAKLGQVTQRSQEEALKRRIQEAQKEGLFEEVTQLQRQLLELKRSRAVVP